MRTSDEMRADCALAVVGTGVLGLSSALELVDRGHDVVLIGPREADTASAAAGAMLCVTSEVSANEPPETRLHAARVRLAARNLYPDWLAGLHERTGRRVSTGQGIVYVHGRVLWPFGEPGGRAGSRAVRGSRGERGAGRHRGDSRCRT